MDAVRPIAMITNQKGMTLVYVAICIVILCGFLGLAVDLGHMQVVRGELQNAADAAALAGAGRLYATPASPGTPPTLDWNTAASVAKAFISENKSDNAALADGTVEVGYWNLTWDPTTNPPLIPATTDPGSLTTDDIAAVKVTISRSAGSNGGPVDTFFMKVLGVDNKPVSSRPAVAVIGFPSDMPPNTVFPFAISQCMTDSYFANPTDPPATIRMYTSYPSGGSDCDTGQWTSFEESTNSANVIRNYINGIEVPSLKTGDDINLWLQSGEKNSLYNEVSKSLTADNRDVLLAIVDTIDNDHDATQLPYYAKIKGFATFHIDTVQNGSGPYIEGHFIDYYTTPPGSLPGGAISNTLTKPMIVK